MCLCLIIPYNEAKYFLQCFFIKIAPVWIRTKIGARLGEDFRQEYMQNNKIKAN